MARLGLQRQTELEIALEFGGDLGVISDGSPVFRDEHCLRGVQVHHRADLAGVKSLTQRRYNAFGLSRESVGLGHQGSPVRVGCTAMRREAFVVDFICTVTKDCLFVSAWTPHSRFDR